VTTAPPLLQPMLEPGQTLEATLRPASGRGAGLRRRLAAAFTAKLSWVALQFAQQFVLVPVFLFYWGPERYGDWVALFSVASALTLFDFGLVQYYGNSLLIAWARRDSGDFDRTLRVGLGLVGFCALVAVAISAPTAWLSPWVELLNLESVTSHETFGVLLALAVCLAARLPLGLVFAIYRARGDQATGIVAETLASLAQFAAVLTVLHSGGGLVEVAVAHTGAAVAAWIGAVVHIRGLYPDLRIRVARPRRREVASALSVAPYFVAMPAALAVQVYGVVLVVAAIAAPAAAVVYTTHRTLTGAARIVVSHLGQAVATELARQQTEGDVAAFGRLYAFLGRLVGGASGGVAGLIAVLGPSVMSVWTFGKIPFDPTVFWALLVAGLVTAPAETADKLLSALNQPRSVAFAFAARSGVAVFGCVALVPSHGAAGAALAIAAAEVLTAVWMLPRDAARYTRAGVIRQIAIGWSAAALSFGLSAGVAFVCVWIAGDRTVAEIAAATALWAAIAAVLAWFVLLDQHQRHDLAARARAALRRRGA
jgi:O-antigen/teichoic acid export membrane protein